MTPTNELDMTRHPCFNPAVKGQFGRIHLPVAPKCNIKCNYCNRKYDCVNESRPGVTSTILSSQQAMTYMEKVLEKEPRITVAGIAGPGDPFANGDETMETLRLIRKKFPDMILCLASNGMAIGPYIEELAGLKVSHVTITVNAVDPEIGKQMYGWVRDGKLAYRGIQAAELLLSRQLAAIRELKKHGITVKINTIVTPGINDRHIPKIAKTMKESGVDLLNCMALFPNVDTPFADIPQPGKEMMERIRSSAEQYVPQMRHCTRCRADAVGLLDNDKIEEFRGCLSACSSLPMNPQEIRPYVAVATLEGVLVNQHLGEANNFQIWQETEQGFDVLEEREAPEPGCGIRRWHKLAKILSDCQAVLVNTMGESPRSVLSKAGLKPVEMSGFIEDGLTAIYTGQSTESLKGRRSGCNAGGCKGTGSGCI